MTILSIQLKLRCRRESHIKGWGYNTNIGTPKGQPFGQLRKWRGMPFSGCQPSTKKEAIYHGIAQTNTLKTSGFPQKSTEKPRGWVFAALGGICRPLARLASLRFECRRASFAWRRGSWARETFNALDVLVALVLGCCKEPWAKSVSTFCGFCGKPRKISTNKLKFKDPTQ